MKKKFKVKNIGTSFDRLLNYNLTDDVDINDQMLELADAILGNCPVLVNFEAINDLANSNRVLSFLSGLIYGVGGEAYQIGKESYLIATFEAFKDGSLHKYVENVGHYGHD